MDIYAENILDHYRAPRGKLAVGGWQLVQKHTESNPTCGDEITVGLDIQNGYIRNIVWDGTGCAISQAAMSMLSEEFTGKSVEDIENFSTEDMLALLGVKIGPRRLKCALLGLDALKKAIRSHGALCWSR